MRLLRNILGRNTAALPWAESVIAHYGLTGCPSAVLYFIATNTSFRMWRKFFMCIEALKKKLGYCRSSVEKALKLLRDLKILSYDGQVHVGKRRPVAVYRLSGTPECPLPGWVVEAREKDREEVLGQPPEWDTEEALTCTFTYRTEQTERAASLPTTEAESSATREGDGLSITSSKKSVANTRPAEPVKTRPQAQQQGWGGVTARRGPYVGRAVRLAERLLEHRATAGARAVLRGSQEGRGGGSVGVGEMLYGDSTGAVTYCQHPARGTEVTPFTETALFTIPTAPAPLKPDVAREFDTFWTHYPRKTGKGAARRAFTAALRKTDATTIIEAVTAFEANCHHIGKETQYTPHPATWLNQERWDDELEPAPQVRSRVGDAFTQNMALVEYYRQQETTGNTPPKAIGW